MPHANEPILPSEGCHVLHLFLSIEHGQWELLDPRSKIEAKTAMAAMVQEIRAEPETQLLTFSVVTPKADLGFMMVTPDLHVADAFAKRLALSLGPDMLTPEFAYFSVTETSEFNTTEAGSSASSGSKKWDPLKPSLPDWPVLCFYPMSHRRLDGHNWYNLDPATRKNLMSNHTKARESHAAHVRQLVTASTGLDDMEWGVTLFAHSTSQIKDMVHNMRYDEVNAKYTDFGACFIGLQLPLDALFHRLGL